ncbi:hypothetical protein Tco_0669594 [Tanacetum coccineum]
MQVPPHVEFVHLLELEPTTLFSLNQVPQLVIGSRIAVKGPTATKNDCHGLMASIGSSPCLKTDMVIHTVKIDEVRQIVDVESSSKSADEIDKETVSFGEMQLKQEDRSCIHELRIPNNERLLEQVISKDIVNILVNSSVNIASVNVHECEKCLKLETELLNKKDLVEKEIYDKLFKSFTTLEKHCISSEVDIQHNQEIFQRDNSVSNQSALSFDQFCSGTPLHEITPTNNQFRLMPNPPLSTPFVPPLRTDWDILFQLMFNELLTPPPSIDLPTPVVIALIDEVVAPVPAVSTGSPSSTTVDQDAPSPSNSQTKPKTQPPVIPNDVEEDNHDIEVAHMANDLKWTKDHPLENIIGELDRLVSTRLQLHEQALFCYYDAFLTAVKPKRFKDALTHPAGRSMQERAL